MGVPGRPIGSALVSKKNATSMKQYWVYDSDSVPASRYLSVVRRWSCVTHYSFVRSLQVTCIRLQLGFLSSSPPTERDRVRLVVCARGGTHTANGFEARHLRRRRPCGRGAHVAAHASEARGASALSCRPFTCTACACTRHARGICVHCMHARHACAANSLWATVARMCTPGNRRARGGCGRRGYGTRRCARRLDQGVLRGGYRLGPCGRQRGAVCR